MRKVFVNVTVKLEIDMDEGVEVSDVINEMDYDFNMWERTDCDITNTEITDFEVIDSK
jgi:hypothetical protein